MESQYISEYPDIAFDSEYKDFFQRFYKASDDADLPYAKYADFFTEDATLKIGSKGAQGREGIISFRAGMWEKVSSRSHSPKQVYPFGPNSNACMLWGTVDFTSKAGSSVTIDWAGRAVFEKTSAGPKLKDYQVYLDPSGATK